MTHKTGTYLGGVRSISDLRDRCYVDEDTGCWHWRLTMSDGLPKVHLHGKQIAVRGRKAALLLSGCKFLPKQVAVPKCESMDCVNPSHAFVGTRTDHAQWMRDTGKSKTIHKKLSALRARTARSKLSLEIAREMRASNEPTVVLARRHKVSESVARAARTGRSWREFEVMV